MLIEIDILCDMCPIAVVNTDFIQSLRYTTYGNSSHPLLVDKSYTTITMADGSEFWVEMSIERTMEKLKQLQEA